MPFALEGLLEEPTKQENRDKLDQAHQALRALGLSDFDFEVLSTADCIDVWAEDVPGHARDADEILTTHIETGYFKDIITKALEA